MGAGSSTGVPNDHLVKLLKENGTTIKQRTAREIVKILEQASPWFLVAGVLNIPNWEQVNPDLQKTLQEKGPEQIPIVTFSVWRLVKDVLLSESVKVRE